MPREDLRMSVYNRKIRMLLLRWEYLLDYISCGGRRRGRFKEIRKIMRLAREIIPKNTEI